MNYIANSVGVLPKYSPLWKKIEEQAHRRLFPTPPPPPPAPPPLLPETDDCAAQITAEIIKEVAEEYGVTTDAIRGPRRNRVLITARFHAIYRVCVERPHLSYPQMGRLFGDRDHTSILNAVRMHCKRNGLSLPRRLVEVVK
jgi:ATPase involved in DNA replication initiation